MSPTPPAPRTKSITDNVLHAANVSQVDQLSPLRYPGGKTWLIPQVCRWLHYTKPKLLVEPFAGGGIVSLTAVKQKLVDRCVMIDLDPNVAVFWQVVLQQNEELVELIKTFELTREQVDKIDQTVPNTPLDHAFRTLVLNRTRRAGILAPGAAPIRKGENSKGLDSRWYPNTLARRIKTIWPYAEHIAFCHADAMQLLPDLLHGWGRRAALFVDPPYTAGGRNPGQRLYAFNQVDHGRLFQFLARRSHPFLMTYDSTPEILDLVAQYGFHTEQIHRTNAHNRVQTELLITPEPWCSYIQLET